MKNLLYFLSLLFVCFSFYMCADEGQNFETVLFDDARISKSEIIIKTNSDGVLMESKDQQAFISYINQKLGTQLDQVNNIELESTKDNSKKNLIFYLTDSKTGTNIPFAFILGNSNGSTNMKNGVLVSFFESHSCSGSPCNCCSFKRHSNGNIYGCECNGSTWRGAKCEYTYGQKCNHSVSSN